MLLLQRACNFDRNKSHPQGAARCWIFFFIREKLSTSILQRPDQVLGMASRRGMPDSVEDRLPIISMQGWRTATPPAAASAGAGDQRLATLKVRAIELRRRVVPGTGLYRDLSPVLMHLLRMHTIRFSWRVPRLI